MWSRHSRWPAEDKKRIQQGLSDFDNDSDEEDGEGWDEPYGKRDPDKSSFPQFKSIKGKDGRYHSGIPTIMEENPSLEGGSSGATSMSLDDTNGSSNQGDDDL